MFKKTLLATTVATIVMSAVVYADDRGGFRFKPLQESANSANWDPSSPWKLPRGYRQYVVSDESNLNVFDGGRDDWPDMNTVNETGPEAGRFMYRTHELRYPGNQPEGGTVSVVDLETGEAHILVQDPSFDALDGIRWSPWGTLVFAEERTGGRFFEIDLNEDLVSAAAVNDRPAVGRLAHEGIDFDRDGNVYIIDEYRGRTESRASKGNTCGETLPCGGGIYKFVPHTYGDLSSGDLYVLGIKDDGGRRNNTGQGEWLGPIDPENARASGSAAGGASFQRPEDIEVINGVLYVAVTEGPRDEYGKEYYEGRVLSINLDTLKVRDFVKPGVNVPVEIGKPGEAGHQSGFDSVDNLAEAPNGDLILIEDNNPSDIWFASTHKVNAVGASKRVKLFASLSDPGAEGTGLYFSPLDPETMYVNVQHSAAEDGDGTWAITRKHRRWHRDD